MEDGEKPIGVFDSGLGGLSVVRELRAALPHEHLLYYADSAYCPYGQRPATEILDRCLTIAGELIAHQAKAIVVACNTASAVCLPELRARFSLPIVGLVPAIKPAAAQSRSKRVAILATPSTIAGQGLRQLVADFGAGADVALVAAPGLVDLVEAGTLHGPEVRTTLQRLLIPLMERGIDTVVLGCTHFPFLVDAMREITGDRIAYLDSGAAIARQTRAVLAARSALNTAAQPGSLRFLTSGDPVTVAARMAAITNELIPVASPFTAGTTAASW